MEDLENEISIHSYPKIIEIDCMEKIIEQMKKNIFKIHKKKGEKGTGFFCNIKYDNNNILKVMITNNHVIDEEYINNYKEIEIIINENSKDSRYKKLILNNNRCIYSSKEYDTTIIEIKEEDKIDSYLELDDNLFKEETNIYYQRKSAYIIQYPSSKEKVSVSYGIINEVNENEIYHYCNTEQGSSGSPILNLLNNKIIGIHKQGSNKFKNNKGTLLKCPINEFINKYKNNKKEIKREKEKEKDNIVNILKIKEDLKLKYAELEKKQTII